MFQYNYARYASEIRQTWGSACPKRLKTPGLDDICPLSSRPARAAPSNPWLSDILREHRTKLRAAERKWRKSNDPSDLSRYQSLLSSFSTEVHTAKSSHFHNKINSAPDMCNLFRTFNYLLCPPPPPPTTSITADDFATFFTDKTRTISNQFSPPHTQDLQPTTSTAQTPIFSFCPLTEAEVSKLLLSSHPTTCPLDPIPSHLLQAISPTLLPALTHIINISPHRHLPHSVQAGSGNPTAQKTYIKHFSFRKLQTCLSPSIRSENTRTSCLQPALIVSFTVQQTGC